MIHLNLLDIVIIVVLLVKTALPDYDPYDGDILRQFFSNHSNKVIYIT